MADDPSADRRTRNHQRWEDKNPRQAIRAKGKFAMGVRANGTPSARPQPRSQRNNRREV